MLLETPMLFEPTVIEGMWKIRIERQTDERGSFGRIFCEDIFRERGLTARFLQISSSRTIKKGTIRGMHLQRSPSSEVKLVQCISGAIHDVVCDVRVNSPTYLAKAEIVLEESDDVLLYIPEGCLHGYQTLRPDSEVYYSISARYDPASACGVRYDDPTFDIKWPLTPVCLSDRDLSFPNYTNNFFGD